MLVVHRRRFLGAYAALAVVLAALGAATWRLAPGHRPGPLAPGAVVLVERFLAAVQSGDLRTACGLFSSFPACNPKVTSPPLRTYEVYAAEAAVDGVDVPATLNGQYALFSIVTRRGGYRIEDVIADPSSLAPPALQLAA